MGTVRQKCAEIIPDPEFGRYLIEDRDINLVQPGRTGQPELDRLGLTPSATVECELEGRLKRKDALSSAGGQKTAPVPTGVEYGEISVFPDVECGAIFPRGGGMRRKAGGILRKFLGKKVEYGEKSLGSKSLCIFCNTLINKNLRLSYFSVFHGLS
jgi:hypothetical protein